MYKQEVGDTSWPRYDRGFRGVPRCGLQSLYFRTGVTEVLAKFAGGHRGTTTRWLVRIRWTLPISVPPLVAAASSFLRTNRPARTDTMPVMIPSVLSRMADTELYVPLWT